MSDTPRTDAQIKQFLGIDFIPAVVGRKLELELADKERENEALRKALQEIFDMPCCMVNDSESLRHTIKTIRFIAENAIKEQSQCL